VAIRVLLADDHKILREGLKKLLKSQKEIEVIGEASDGIQTIEKMHALDPDVILLDIIMPRMNGISAIKKIKESQSETEIVILSIKDDIFYAQQALQAGAIGYLSKRTAADKVVQAVRLAHQGKRFISQEINENLINKYVLGEELNIKDPMGILSPREQDILKLVAEGETSNKIASLLHISENTVKTYRKRLMDKLELDSLQDLVKFAIRHEIISL